MGTPQNLLRGWQYFEWGFFCPVNLKEFYSILFLLVFFICIILPRSLLLQLHFAMSLLAFSDEIFTFAMALFFSSIASVNLVCLLLFLLINFLEPRPRHMEVPRLGVESELQLPAYTAATATQDPSQVCNLYHSSWQCWILNPLIETRDWIHILMNPSQVCYHWAMMGTPKEFLFWLVCSLWITILLIIRYQISGLF